MQKTKKRSSIAGIEAITEKPVKGIMEFKLIKNGLRILLIENHALPVVATNIVYHVGSRNEAVGYTGATHFLEHLMFKGTSRFDPLAKTGIDDLLKKVGGMNNATTWFDRTNYYEVVPKKHLELCLDIEADRMRNLLLRKSDRDAEMTVVRNELERGEDDPDELLETNLFATAFREHPYHHPTIGWRADVEGVPLSRLKMFYDQFYWPDNATLMVLGDFNKDRVLAMIAEKFSSIPSNPSSLPEVYTREPIQEGERRFVVKRGVDVPRMVSGFHVPECMNKDTYALDVLEHILGDTSHKSSRLYKRLIESGKASYVDASNYSLKDPGLFVLSAQTAGETKLETLEALLKEEIQKFKDEKVSDDEIKKAKQSITRSIRLSTADPLGFSMYLTEAIAVANWRWWLDYPDKVMKVTKGDIMAVAKKYFTEDNRTTGYYYPLKSKKKASQESRPLSTKSGNEKSAVEKDTGKVKAGKSGKKVQVDKLIPREPLEINIGKRVKKSILKNGLTVLTLDLPGASTVAISGKVKAGDADVKSEKTLVPEMVAALLTAGSSRFSKEELADKLEMMGAHLGFDSDSFYTEFGSHIVKEDLRQYLDLLSNVVKEPSFSKKELALEIKLKSSDLKERMADTGDMSWNLMMRELYKKSSPFYQKSFKEQLEELDGIKVKDLKSFHKDYFSAQRTVLAFVGCVEHDKVVKLVEGYFGDWKKGSKASWSQSAGDIKSVKGSLTKKAPIKDKANVDIRIARALPVSIGSPDYFACVLANAALGYDSFACRLAPVRDKYGLTYGIYSVIGDPTVPYGPWYIKYSVNPDNIDKGQRIVNKIVADYVKSGITEKELATEKSHLAGIYSVRLRSPKKIANQISFYETIGVPLSYIDDFPGNLFKVSRAEVNKAISSYFDLSRGSITLMSGTFKSKKSEATK